MHLYLSTDSPWKATYSNTEGQTIYKAESPRLPIGIGALPITIERAVPSNVAKAETKDATDDAAALTGPFDFLAEVDFPANPFTESHIRYNNIDMSTNDFFRKTGIFRRRVRYTVPEFDSETHYELYRYRIFKGPDDKEYEWHLGILVCKVCNVPCAFSSSVISFFFFF